MAEKEMIEFTAGEYREYRGQGYRCVSVEPYVRKDGSKSGKAVWAANCARCGEPFTCWTLTPLVSFTPVRRCDVHKDGGSKITKVHPAAKVDPGLFD